MTMFILAIYAGMCQIKIEGTGDWELGIRGRHAKG